ncbi:MAG: hypothetical protein KDI19_15845, partial [Pseudomonadales bacterium]|nr:hypothetical protein [Pseudomonadales bacterium]
MRPSMWIFAIGLLVIGQVAEASIVSVYTSDKRATATYSGVAQSDNDNGTGFGNVSLDASRGSSHSTLDTTWVDTGTGALLDHDISLSFNGNDYDHALARDEYLRFSILDDTTY